MAASDFGSTPSGPPPGWHENPGVVGFAGRQWAGAWHYPMRMSASRVNLESVRHSSRRAALNGGLTAVILQTDSAVLASVSFPAGVYSRLPMDEGPRSYRVHNFAKS